jgi:hypothetical protein
MKVNKHGRFSLSGTTTNLALLCQVVGIQGLRFKIQNCPTNILNLEFGILNLFSKISCSGSGNQFGIADFDLYCPPFAVALVVG